MNLPLTVECPVHFRSRGSGSRQTVAAGAEQPSPASPPARVPRIARLMALALRFEELIRSGEVADYAELARLGRVSRARITQVMNLLALSPAIQEELLFLSCVERGRDPIHLAVAVDCPAAGLAPATRRLARAQATNLRGGGR